MTWSDTCATLAHSPELRYRGEELAGRGIMATYELTKTCVLRGRWKSEPAVTVREPTAARESADPVELRNRRL